MISIRPREIRVQSETTVGSSRAGGLLSHASTGRSRRTGFSRRRR